MIKKCNTIIVARPCVILRIFYGVRNKNDTKASKTKVYSGKQKEAKDEHNITATPAVKY